MGSSGINAGTWGLALIAELSSASWDACGYIASKRAFIRSLTMLAMCRRPFEDAVPHGNPASSTPLQTCWPYMLDVAESAQLVLANASSGALAQRDAIVRVHGILNSANTAKVIMLALRDAFVKVMRQDHTDATVLLLYF